MQSDDSNDTLYTIVNKVTGHVDDSITLEAFPSLGAPVALDEMW